MCFNIAHILSRFGKAAIRLMLQRCLLLLSLLLSFTAHAAIDQVEYFFNADPGDGAGISVAFTPSGAAPLLIDAAAISTNGLSVGKNILYIRARDNVTGWGPTRQYPITISYPASTITEAEMFVDSDPGEGNGMPIPVSADGAFDSRTEFINTTLNTQGWVAGDHKVYVRARNSLGIWGAPEPVINANAPNVTIDENKWAVRAEYFFDVDPGDGLGGELILRAQGGNGAPAMIDLDGIPTEGLIPGKHTLFLRIQDSEGVWGTIRSYPFNVIQTTYTLTGSEFFIDNDPGAGAGMPLSSLDGTWDGGSERIAGVFDVSALTPGPHTLCVRAQDNTSRWSGVPVAPQHPMCKAFDVLAPNSEAILSGIITEQGTGEPLIGVTVASDEGRQTRTLSDGSYTLIATEGGRTITVTASGYQPIAEAVTVVRPTTEYPFSMTKLEGSFGLQRFQGSSPDPVNTATGNYYYSRSDLKVGAPGVPFEFTRFYNAQDLTSSSLGAGWSHNLDIYVYPWNDLVYVKFGDGRVERYLSDGAGNFIPQRGVYSTLNLTNGTYTLITKDIVQYQFDTAGKLIAKVDRNGNTLTINRDDAGKITSAMDSAGRSYLFSYDSEGFLSSITDPLGRAIFYEMDSLGNLITATDATGNTTRYFYDSHHLLLTMINPRGQVVVSNVYDELRRIVSYQSDALGNVTTFQYNPLTRTTAFVDPTGGVTKHVYDGTWRLVEIVDALNNSATYAYDNNHNRTQVVDQNGNQVLYSYDARGNVVSRTDALGNVVSMTYDLLNNPLTRTDARGNTTRFSYDASGNLITNEDAAGNLTTIVRDSKGRPLSVNNPRGNTTTNTYDVESNLIQVADALGNQTLHAYDAVGRRLSTVDALGNTTGYSYDNNDNLLTRTDVLGNTVTNAYDGNGNRISTIDPNGNMTRFVFDAKDQLITVTDALGNDTRYTYDANGNRLTAINALGNTTAYVYDSIGRRLSGSDPLGNITATSYDPVGNVLSVINANGQASNYSYDSIRRLAEVQDATGNRVLYTYDANGNRVAMTDPNGNTSTFTYDVLNRVATKAEPLGNTTAYQYDEVGNMVQRTDPDGSVIGYQYDALNRLVMITYPGSSTVTFTYDAIGNRVQMADSLGVHNYGYDALGRMTSHTDPYGNTVGYDYDANGNRATLSYPGGLTVSYGYDGLNRMTNVADWLGNTTTYNYDAIGRLISRNYPNGTKAAYGYDGADRLVSLNNVKSDNSVISSHAYTLDGIGNPVQEIRDEPLGPILITNTTSYSYDAENRLTSMGGVSNTFDANGNITVKGVDTYGYDYENRLIQSTIETVASSYQYDGLGNRYSKTADSVTTRYVLDTNTRLTNVLAETDSTGSVLSRYVYGLGLVSQIESDNTVHYYHYDPRGSSIALTDTTESVEVKYAYDQFGRVANSEGVLNNPFKYAGRYGVVDDGSAIYIRARYYDPVMGRFLTKDLLEGNDRDGQSLNRFIYVSNNPIRLVDISGYSPLETQQSNADIYGSTDYLNAQFIEETSFAVAQYLLEETGRKVAYEILREGVINIDTRLISFGTLANNAFDALSVIGVLSSGVEQYYRDKYSDIDPLEKAAKISFAVGYKATAALLKRNPSTALYGIGLDAAYDTNPDAVFNKFKRSGINVWLGNKLYGWGLY